VKPAGQLITGVSWLMLAVAPCGAQDINFRDLQRPGPPAVKRVVIAGSLADANRIYSSFGDADSSERADAAATRSAQSSAGGSAGDSSSSSRSGQEYVCKFTCYAVNSGMFNNKSNGGGTVTVRADSYDAAKRIVVSREKSICNGSTLTRNQAWGGDSVDCSRK